MSKIAIVTDSNSGISQERAKEMGIFVLPMPFLINGKEHLDGIDLFPPEFYEYLKQDAQEGAGGRRTFSKEAYARFIREISGMEELC